MIYAGENRAKLFRGDHKPAAWYKGSTRYAGYDTVTLSGESITAENTYNDTAQLYIYGNTQQETQAASANILNLDNVIFRSNSALVSKGETCYRDGDDVVGVHVAGGGMGGGFGVKIRLTPGATYTLGITELDLGGTAAGPIEVQSYTAEPTSVFDGQYGETQLAKYFYAVAGLEYLTFTMPADREWVAIVKNVPANNTSADQIIRFRELRLVKGTENPVEYEPYAPEMPSPERPGAFTHAGGTLTVRGESAQEAVTVNVPTLLSVGGTQDAYNVSTGQIDKRVMGRTLYGTESYTMTTAGEQEKFETPNGNSGSYGMLCSHLKYNTGDSYVYNAGAGKIGFAFPAGRFGSVEAFAAWVAEQNAAGTPVTVFYAMATPMTQSVTPVSIPTYYPTTTITKTGLASGMVAILKQLVE